MPQNYCVERTEGVRADDNERAEFTAFAETIAAVEHNHDFVVIDTPGNDSYLMRLAHAMADTLITPLNDSFVDFDVLGTVDPQTYALTGTSHYSEMVREARRHRRRVDQEATDWIVVRNRLSTLGSRNKRLLAEGLNDLGLQLGFRSAEGFAERVIYREFFPRGLTALDDINESTLGTRPNLSHVTAREEVQALARRPEASDRRKGQAPRRRPLGMVRRPGPPDRGPRRPGLTTIVHNDCLNAHEPVTARRAHCAAAPSWQPIAAMAAGSGCRHEQGPSRRPAPVAAPRPGQRAQSRPESSRREIDAFLDQVRSLGAVAAGRPARAADFRARRHHEPAADLGHAPASCRPTCSAKPARSAASTSSSSISAA